MSGGFHMVALVQQACSCIRSFIIIGAEVPPVVATVLVCKKETIVFIALVVVRKRCTYEYIVWIC